jgi:hypothetical protein
VLVVTLPVEVLSRVCEDVEQPLRTRAAATAADRPEKAARKSTTRR